MSALVWSPFSDRQQVRDIAEILLTEKLAACVNVIDTIESVFMWKGEINSATECVAIFKTDHSLLDKLINRIEELHPYQEPAILGWKCEGAGVATRIWLGKLAERSGGSEDFET